MEGAFPRGRGSEDAAPKAAKRSLSAAPHSGRLFGAKKAAEKPTTDKRKGDGKKRSKSAKPATAKEVVADSAPLMTKSRADELTFKSAVLALPHGLTGHVSLDHTNDVLAATVKASRKTRRDGGDSDPTDGADGEVTLASFLQPGQYVLACVTRVGTESLFDTSKPAAVALAQSLSASASAAAGGGDDRNARRIELSLRPELANQGLTLKELRNGSLVHGYVRSVEDNGYVVSTGIAGVDNAFLPFSQSDGTNGQAGVRLPRQAPGCPIMGVVWSINRDSGVVSLSCTADRVAALVSREPLHTIYTVKPGLAVTATVDRVLPNGLAVTFLSFFHATVHVHHLPSPAHALWGSDYAPGSELRCRILYVDAGEKTIALTAAPHATGLGRVPGPLGGEPHCGIGGPLFDVGEGGKLLPATVLRVDVGVGMLLGWATPSEAADVEAAGAAAAASEAVKKAAKAAEKAAKKAKKGRGKGASAEGEDEGEEGEGAEEGDVDMAGEASASSAAAIADAPPAAAGPFSVAAAAVASGKRLPMETLLRVGAQWGRTAYVHISRAGVPPGKDGAKPASTGGEDDDKVEHIERHYRPGQTVPARVLSFAPVEGHALATTKTAIVEAAVLRPSDVTVGSVLEGTVAEVLADGDGGDRKPVDFGTGKGVAAVVRLGEGVKGIVTALHCGDVLPTKAAGGAKQRAAYIKALGLVPGAKVRVRVLSVDASSGTIHLTLKKSLLTSPLPVIAGYEQAYRLLQAAAPGPLLTHGFVTGLREGGVLVTFYGGAAGFLPASDLVEHGVIPRELATDVPSKPDAEGNPRTNVHVPVAALARVYAHGSPLRVRVATVAISKQRIKLSVGGMSSTSGAPSAPGAAPGVGQGGATAMDGPSAMTSTSNAAAAAAALAAVAPEVEVPLPEPGATASAVVVTADASKRRLLVKLTAVAASGSALEALPAGSGVYAELPFAHLADSAGAVADSEAVAACYPPGTPLTGLLVLQQLPQGKGAARAALASSLPPPSLLVTAKPLLRYAASSAPGVPSDMLPSSQEDVRPGLLVAGYVASVTAFAAFVRFMGGCTGAAPRSRWPAAPAGSEGEGGEGDESTAAASELFSVGQTVLAVVEKVADATSGGADDGKSAARGRFTLSLLPASVARALPAAFFAENAAPAGALTLPLAGSAASVSGPASAAAAYLHGHLLQQELALLAPQPSSEDEAEASPSPSASRPSRSVYRVGSTVAARVKAASSGGLIVEVAPQAEGGAPVLGFALPPASASGSSESPLPAVGSVVPVVVLDVNPAKGLLHVQLQAPAAAGAEASAAGAVKPAPKKAKKGSAAPAPAAAEALAFPSSHAELAPPPSSSSSPKLGESVSVTVLLKPCTQYAVVRLPGGGVGYAATADLTAPLGAADSEIEVGGTYEAVVTQLPAPAGALPAGEDAPAAAAPAAGKRKRKDASSAPASSAAASTPASTASSAVAGLTLLTLVPAMLAARKGTAGALGRAGKAGSGASSSSGGGAPRSGVAIESLLPGMTLTARIKAPAKGGKGSGEGSDGEDSDASGDDDASDGGRKTTKKGKAAPAAASAAASRVLHLLLGGVVGRYEASLSLGEAVDADPYAGKLLDASPAEGAARFVALASSPPGSELRVKIVSITVEDRGAYDKRSRVRATAGAVVASVPFYRVAVTVRPSDLALPELALASHRPAWEAAVGGAAESDEGAAPSAGRITSESLVVAASASALAAAGPACVHLPPSAAPVPQPLLPGATGWGVVEGFSPDGAFLWVGLGGGVHARAFALECGDSDDIRDPSTGALRATPEAAAALSASRLGRSTHPVGSLVRVVLTSVDAARRRADVSVRAAAAAAGVAEAAASSKPAGAAAAGAKKKARMEPASVPALSPSESFVSACAAVAKWLAARPDAGRPTPGQVVLARIAAPSASSSTGGRYPSSATSLRLQLGGGHVHGRVDITQAGDRSHWSSKPLSSYTEGQVVRAVVLPGPPASAAPAPPSSSAPYQSHHAEVELSLRPSAIAAALEAAAAPPPAPAAAAPAGGKRKRKESSADLAAAPAPAAAAAGGFPAAAAALSSLDSEERTAASAPGALVSGYVVSISDKGAFVRVARGTTARVLLKHLSDAFVKAPTVSFAPGKLVTGRVLPTSQPSAGRLDMSLRLTDTDPEAAAAAAAAREAGGKGGRASASASASASLLGFGDLRAGLALEGRVTKTADYGVFVALDGTDRAKPLQQAEGEAEGEGSKPRSSSSGRAPVPISGLVHVSEVDDVKPPTHSAKAGKKDAIAAAVAKLRGELPARFSVGDRVRVVVVSVEPGEKKLALSMRPSRLEKAEEAPALQQEGEEEGEDEEGEDEEGVIALGENDEEEDEDDDEEGDEENVDDEEDEDSDDEEVTAPAKPSRSAAATRGIYGALDDEEDDEESEEEEDSEGEAEGAPARGGASKPLGFAWGASAAGKGGDDDDDAFADDGEGSDGEGEGGAAGGKAGGKGAKKKARARAAAAEEAETSRRERRLVTGEASDAPETAEDFERLVASSPHSSLAWIRYMAWQLSLSEVAKARDVAERALGAIPYREEEEKLNVWTALLNLEAQYGTPSTTASVFARAQGAADPRAVHMALLGVYQRGGAAREAEAEALFALTAKKFGRTGHEVWTQWAAAKFRRGDAPGARALLPRALQQLPKPAHVEAISRFALLEYAFAPAAATAGDSEASGAGPYGLGSGAGSGSQERGRTMLQGLLQAVPKRLDLWSVYLDQEIAAFVRRHGGAAAAAAAAKGGKGAASKDGSGSTRSDDLAFIRSVFDRVLTLKHSSKKVKFIVKRYLAFEGAHGDAAGVKRVQEAARAYVASLVQRAIGAEDDSDAGSA